MPRVRSIQDVVDYRLCMGCGACVHVVGRDSGAMVDIPTVGLRPFFSRELSAEEEKRALSVCPGIRVTAPSEGGSHVAKEESSRFDSPVAGRGYGAWEGYASDSAVRAGGSSGGVITTLCQYCLDERDVDVVSHVGMAREEPWKNTNVLSETRAELERGLGSRYAASSPCLSLSDIQRLEGKAVFVGKPCDAAAVALVLQQQPQLRSRIAAVISFFCAGTPSSAAASELLERNGADLSSLNAVTFRGEGWPGRFAAIDDRGDEVLSLSYSESWAQLQRSRGLRCSLCADGMGEVADIACGDAWHRHTDDDNPGMSVVIARTQRGRQIIEGAHRAGYLHLERVGVDSVVRSQGSEAGLVKRRVDLWGRLLALRLFGIPIPRYQGIRISDAWDRNSLWRKARTVLGTMRRVVRKKLWKRMLLQRPHR